MKKRKVFIIATVVCIAVCAVVYTALIFPLFDISYLEKQTLFEKVKEKYAEDTVILAEYQYTTGTGWSVVDCTDEKLVGENIVLYTHFDPRLLIDNSDFFMDYSSKYVIVVRKIAEVTVDEKSEILIKPKKIIVNNSVGEKKSYTIKDFSASGVLKSVLSFINKRYMYCY